MDDASRATTHLDDDFFLFYSAHVDAITMQFISAQIKCSLVRPVQTSIPGQDLVLVRELYLERRYKRCMALCEDLLKPNLHPVHEAFLHYHQAICFEILGLAAHNYSRNKIPFLESAKEKFAAALDVLPQPFTTDEAGYHDTPKISPLVSEFLPTERNGSPCEPFPNFVVSPLIHVSTRTRTPSEASSHYSTTTTSSTTSTFSEVHNVPDFDKYSPRADYLPLPKPLPRTVTFPNVPMQEHAWNQSSDSPPTEPRSVLTPHQSRLSACLSSTHILANDLVPSPLFSRTKKIAQVPFPNNAVVNTNTIIQPAQAHTTSNSPRPIPRTPNFHQSHLTLLTARRTAVQTLICKFEDKLPSPGTPSEYTTATPPSTAMVTPNTNAYAGMMGDRTPATARFTAIANIFAHSTQHPPSASSRSGLRTPDNFHDAVIADVKENKNAMENYLSSRALSRYNASLASFRTSLLASVTTAEELIETAHHLQEKRAKEKQERERERTVPEDISVNGGTEAGGYAGRTRGGGLGGVRLRSMWLLESAGLGTGAGTTTGRRGKDPGRGKVPAVDRGRARNRHDSVYSSVHPSSQRNKISNVTDAADPVAAPAMARAQTDSPVEKFRARLPSLRPLEDPTRKAERMAKLRAREFKVRKEYHGFKGQWWYEDLRRRGEMELSTLLEQGIRMGREGCGLRLGLSS